jgi:hypothetical protein
MDDQRGENPNGIWHFLCPNHTDSISEMETSTCVKLVLCNEVKRQIQISHKIFIADSWTFILQLKTLLRLEAMVI